MQPETGKKEEAPVAEANNPLPFISNMGSNVMALIGGWMPALTKKAEQFIRQQIQNANTYSVDDNELRDYAKGFTVRNPDASLGSGEKLTKFSAMKSPIPGLYSALKVAKDHKKQNELELASVIDLLTTQKNQIGSNSKFEQAMSNIIATMCNVQTKCADYKADYAEGKEEETLKTLYSGIVRLITGSNAQIATTVKKYIQQKMDWTADIDKYKFYFMVCLICSKNDPGMGLCGRAMLAEQARLPLPNTAKRESE